MDIKRSSTKNSAISVEQLCSAVLRIKMSFKICHISFVAFVIGFSSAAIPSYIKVCKRNDPNIDQCIINSINALTPNLKQGIPELNIPSIEPFLMERITLKHNIDCDITNIKIFGAGAFQIKQLKSEIGKNRFAGLLSLDKIFFTGEYTMNSKFLNIPLVGEGNLSVNLTNINAAARLKAKRVKKGGITYFNFESIKLKLAVDGRSDLELDGLFKDNPTLNEAATGVLKDNARLFVDEVLPQMEVYLADMFMDIANKITEKYSFEELFPVD